MPLGSHAGALATGPCAAAMLPGETDEPAGVVLAGGHSTRLGLLTPRPDKIHLCVDDQPILVRHLRFFAASGLEKFGVVVAPESVRSTRRLLERCWPAVLSRTRIVEQREAVGPGDALARAAATFSGSALLVVLADTVADQLPLARGDWIGVAPPPSERRWCRVISDLERRVVDVVDCATGPHDSAAEVAVGLYHFSDPALLAHLCAKASASHDAELEISAIIGPYARARDMRAVPIPSWRDCGDLASHATLQTGPRKTRAGQAIETIKRGYLTKSGSSDAFRMQAKALERADADQSLLFPRVIAVAHDHSSYTIEHVDLPNLSELFLYRSTPLTDWQHVLDDLIATVNRAYWCKPARAHLSPAEIASIYTDQIETRWAASLLPKALRSANALIVNGRRMVAGSRAIDLLVAEVNRTPTCRPGQMHGDLNFSNILYSATYGYFRLVDPRGGLGSLSEVGDAYYDAAKLRQSYSGMYDAILHGLYSIHTAGHGVDLDVFPSRAPEVRALDELLHSRGFDLNRVRLLEALQLIGCANFHLGEPTRMIALYARGLQGLDALMNDRTNS